MVPRIFQNLFFALVALAVTATAHSSLAQDTSTSPLAETADTLEAMATRTSSLGIFGRSVKDGALLAAASQLRKGDVKDDVVEVGLNFSVTELSRPRVPNRCFEICLARGQSSARGCYVECEAPIPPIEPVRVDDLCTQLWEEFREGTGNVMIILQLMRNGCIEIVRARRAVTFGSGE